MRLDDAEHQAAAFLAYRRKCPGECWEQAFARWVASKALDPGDEGRIRWLVWGELLGRGEITSTDPYDYLSAPHDAA